MAELAVTAMGADRPGIVAAVAAVLRDHGGNVEDSAMTILRGRFSLALVVESDTPAEDLEAALHAATGELGLTLSVDNAGATARSAAPTHLLSVYGEDQPGILAEVTAALAAADANVTDLVTRLIGSEEQPVWSMVVEFATDDPAAVGEAVGEVASRMGVDHTLRSLDAETY